MEPISAGLQILGLGMSLFGGFSASNDSKKLYDVQKGIAADEQRINDVKKQQMLFEGRRAQLEQYRQAQKLRSQAVSSAVDQGAGQGSGLQGGLSEITGQKNYNLFGIQQGMQFSNTIFGINNDISNKKMQVADIQSSLAQDQAWSSMGGALVKNAGTISGLGKDIFAGFNSSGSGSDYPWLSGGIGSK